MIQTVRKEATSGTIDDDLAHIRTHFCLGYCLTKQAAKSDELRKAGDTGVLIDVDMHPAFRTLLQHRDYLLERLVRYVGEHAQHCLLLGEQVWQWVPCINLGA